MFFRIEKEWIFFVYIKGNDEMLIYSKGFFLSLFRITRYV